IRWQAVCSPDAIRSDKLPRREHALPLRMPGSSIVLATGRRRRCMPWASSSSCVMSAGCRWRRWLSPGCWLSRQLPQPSWARAKLSNLIKRSPPAIISGISSPVSATKISHSASSVRRSRLLPELTESREHEEEKNMRATVYHGPRDMRIDQVPDPIIQAPTDVVARITHAGICGSDLWPYRGIDHRAPGERMGHEWMGMVEEVGTEVRTIKKGDRVISPFLISDGTCEFCHEGLQSSCVHGQRYGGPNGGGQGEAVRVPNADGTLVVLPPSVEGDEHLLKAILPLTDVMATGHHAAITAGVRAG